jgi:cytochrome c-type biogenesis protein CcmH/NrfG
MSASEDPLVGKEIAGGRYLVVNVLGRGGMGTVYTALQRPVDRKVALKIIHRELAGNPEIVARFLEEMRLTAAIEHPHTVRVYDFGDIDGQPFLTTEFLDGRSLRDELLRHGTLPQERVAAICAQIAKALRAAAAHGVVHRDLKPENIMLLDLDGDADYVKVLDFGIARSLHKTTGFRTGTGALLGTPAYMSPEQCEGKRVDGRSDLYTLGLIAYELATGALPFPLSDSVPQLLLAHVSTPPPDVGARAAQLSPGMAALIMRLLAKSPDARPADADAVIAALEPFLSPKRPSATATAAMAATQWEGPATGLVGARQAEGRPPAALGSRVTVPPVAAPGSHVAEPPAAPATPAKKRALWLSLAIAVVVAAGGAWFVHARRGAVEGDCLAGAGRDPWAAAHIAGLPDLRQKTLLEQVVATCPASADAQVMLGKVLGRLGEEDAAEQHLRRALELDPRSRPARFSLAVVLIKRGKHPDSLPLLDALLTEEPRHPTAHLVRGQARLATRNFKGAVEDLEQQVQLDPQSPTPWRLLAAARKQAGDDPGSQEALHRALQLRPP